jgi:hypothetical protein
VLALLAMLTTVTLSSHAFAQISIITTTTRIDISGTKKNGEQFL